MFWNVQKQSKRQRRLIVSSTYSLRKGLDERQTALWQHMRRMLERSVMKKKIKFLNCLLHLTYWLSPTDDSACDSSKFILRSQRLMLCYFMIWFFFVSSFFFGPVESFYEFFDPIFISAFHILLFVFICSLFHDSANMKSLKLWLTLCTSHINQLLLEYVHLESVYICRSGNWIRICIFNFINQTNIFSIAWARYINAAYISKLPQTIHSPIHQFTRSPINQHSRSHQTFFFCFPFSFAQFFRNVHEDKKILSRQEFVRLNENIFTIGSFLSQTLILIYIFTHCITQTQKHHLILISTWILISLSWVGHAFINTYF